MRVLVYVEGPSDRAALEALLEPVISAGRERRVGLRFLVLNDKASILKDSGRKAADHLSDNPGDWVFALPDLYPMSVYDGTPEQHRSFAELDELLRSRFRARAARVGVPEAARNHFRVHCLKYDLEGLLLAAPDALKRRLQTADTLNNHWRRPVEDQNDNNPPKRVVEGLFEKYRRKPKYTDTTDAPWILKRTPLETVVAACSQRFAPFVAELAALANGSAPT
ncbi:MAG: DUF4276 family protein [Treponema sp.]|nr:DUF4276 family protein [Treponema sp.]